MCGPLCYEGLACANRIRKDESSKEIKKQTKTDPDEGTDEKVGVANKGTREQQGR